jgi:hypothetical protein
VHHVLRDARIGAAGRGLLPVRLRWILHERVGPTLQEEHHVRTAFVLTTLQRQPVTLLCPVSPHARVYHINPATFGDIPANENTGDLHGDEYFLLRSVMTPMECREGGRGNDCNNAEVVPTPVNLH